MERVIAVIGGGWAGCAAAVEMTRGGWRVELHEAAAVLGGRARRVDRDSLPLDNGEHLLLGAYRETLALAAAIHEPRRPWTTAPLSIRPWSERQAGALSFTAGNLPAPLGLLSGLLRASGLGWRERGATIRWFLRQRRRGYRCARDATVEDLFDGLPRRVLAGLWAPICVAALNTPPHRASGQVFLNVVREAFGGGARGAAIVTLEDGLGETVPAQAARWIAGHGGRVRTSTHTRVVARDAQGVVLEAAGAIAHADAVVVAVGPHQLASVFAPALAAERRIAAALADVARFEYEPITTVYLGYDAPLALPGGLLRLDDAPGQWLFDRSDILRRGERPQIRSLVAVVISAHGAHEALAHPALVAAIDAQLRKLGPRLPRLCWSQAIEEKRATYACVPALAHPACGRLADCVYLAGDYTYPEFPATLEAAVRSGLVAAAALTRDLRT